MYDEIINLKDSVSRNVTNILTSTTNTISTNVPNAVSVSSEDKKSKI